MQHEEIVELINKAKAISKKAYAIYSNFKVGAVIKTDNNIYLGFNIENASYSLTNCAERVALQNALVNEDNINIKAIAIYAETTNFISPCGACRQVLLEFLKNDTPIILANNKMDYKITNIKELLPFNFTKEGYLDA